MEKLTEIFYKNVRKNSRPVYLSLDIDFTPEYNQVIYYEPSYNTLLNCYIKEHYLEICQLLEGIGKTFCYFPQKALEIGKNALSYYAPSMSGHHKINNNHVDFYSKIITPYFVDYKPSKPALLRFDSKEFENGKYCYKFKCFQFDEDESIFCQFKYYASKAEDSVTMSCITTDIDEEYDADNHFNSDINNIMHDVREKVDKLRQLGVDEAVLKTLIEPDTKPSRMIITKDFRILLPDFNNMEINMSPLPKAVYLLFLKHPEGILFRNLPYYRDELLDIYLKLTDRETGTVIMKSIDALTNPRENSINEKCARVREAFISRFNEKTLAKYYIINGEYGREKKIMLDRNLVVWE